MKGKSKTGTFGVVLVVILVVSGVAIAGVDTMTFVQSYDVSTEESAPTGIHFNSDGTKAFMLGYGSDSVHSYSLSTPYDISSATYGSSFDVSTEDSTPKGLTFNNDGSKMYVSGDGGVAVYEYSLSTPFDVTTASFTTSFSTSTQMSTATGVEFNDDGSKMYVVGNSNDAVYEYSLSTPFDISTASYNDNFPVSEDSQPEDIAFNGDGTEAYIVGGSNDNVYEYSLSTAYDISTASFVQSKDVGTEDTGMKGVTIEDSGSKMYGVGTQNANIYEYNSDVSGYENEVSGIVEDSSDNTRIEGATVEAKNSSGDVVASDTTNSNGEYSLNVSDGEYTFVASADKYEDSSHTMNVSGDVLLDFSLDRIIIDGRVVDTTGSGLADANVDVIDGFGNVVTSASTNSTGHYSVWVANGTYDFNASKSGYTDDSITYTVSGSGSINDHTLESQGLVDGYVTDLDDKRIENATVTIYENGTKVDSMLTTKNGNFSFNVTNGDYMVEVDKHQYRSYSENFTVNGGYNLGKLQIEAREYDLTMQVSPYMNYTQTQEIVVRFNDEDVTDNVTITLSGDNASNILTYHPSNNTLVATGNQSFYGEINVNATYDGTLTDKTVYVDENVTVAPLTIEHVEILSPLYMTITIIDNQPMQYVFFVVIAGVGAAILTTRSGGMGLMIISLIGGWIAGFIGLGIVLASLFAGMFIMLNTQDRMRYG